MKKLFILLLTAILTLSVCCTKMVSGDDSTHKISITGGFETLRSSFGERGLQSIMVAI